MPEDLLASGALAVLVTSFGVGIVVGLTGMGGGALMTPALVFLGVPPTAAVANDLVAAALNKSVGAAVHVRSGTPDRRLAGLLVAGSVPCALAGPFVLAALGPGERREGLLRGAIGVALLGTAAAYALRTYGARLLRRGPADGPPQVRAVPTIVVGAVGGLLVGLTSVGSGSVIMIGMLLLYPALSPRRLVGTDLLQAVPLVVAAAIGHAVVTGIDPAVLVPLVVGGAPGTFLGARLAARVPVHAVRRGIIVVLALTGLALLGVPPRTVGALGALLVLAAMAWSLLPRAHERLRRARPRREALAEGAPRAERGRASADHRFLEEDCSRIDEPG